jgi:hypothetical protein
VLSAVWQYDSTLVWQYDGMTVWQLCKMHLQSRTLLSAQWQVARFKRLGNRGSVSVRVRARSPTQGVQRQDPLWGPPNLVFKHTSGSSLTAKLTHDLSLPPRRIDVPAHVVHMHVETTVCMAEPAVRLSQCFVHAVYLSGSCGAHNEQCKFSCAGTALL